MGRSGAIFTRARRRRSLPEGRGAARERGLRGVQRRLAGFCAQRRNDVVISVGRARQCRSNGRNRQALRAGTRLRQQCGSRDHACAVKPDAAIRSAAGRAIVRLGDMASVLRRALRLRTCRAGRSTQPARGLESRAAQPSGQDVSGGHGGKSQRALGRQRRRTRRLLSGLAARPGPMRHRIAGDRRRSRSARYASLPDRHAECRWTLESEPVAGRALVLARGPAR